MRIKQVIPKENYHLFIESEKGDQGIFDVKPYPKSEAFLALQRQSEFQKIKNGKYFIEWDCGADLSADTIEAEWKTANKPFQTIANVHGVPHGYVIIGRSPNASEQAQISEIKILRSDSLKIHERLFRGK